MSCRKFFENLCHFGRKNLEFVETFNDLQDFI